MGWYFLALLVLVFLGRKKVTILADMCPQCGVLRGRQVTKQRISAASQVKSQGIVLPNQGN